MVVSQRRVTRATLFNPSNTFLVLSLLAAPPPPPSRSSPQLYPYPYPGYSNAEAAKAAVQQVLSAGGRDRAGSIDRIRPTPSMSVPSTPDILQNLPKSTLQPGYTPNLGSLPSSPTQLVEDAISLQAFSSPMKKHKNNGFTGDDFVGIPSYPRTPDTYDKKGRAYRGGGRHGGAGSHNAPLTPAQHKMLSIGSSQSFSPSPRVQSTPLGGAMQSPGLRHQINGRGGGRMGTHSLNPSPVAASSYLKGKGDKYSHHGGGAGGGGASRSSRRSVTLPGGNSERSPPTTPSMVCLSPSKMVKLTPGMKIADDFQFMGGEGDGISGLFDGAGEGLF